jgi:hypothetical protein
MSIEGLGKAVESVSHIISTIILVGIAMVLPTLLSRGALPICEMIYKQWILPIYIYYIYINLLEGIYYIPQLQV